MGEAKPMVQVRLWSSLRRLTGGEEMVAVEASTVAEMIYALKRKYPALGPILDGGVAVSVNGEVVPNRLTRLDAESEIFLLQPLKGG